MQAKIQAFWLPKAGNSSEDYEDAAWPTGSMELVSPPIRLAVGDGATETSFSALWAKLLVQDFGEGRFPIETFSERVPILQDRWLNSVSGQRLPWYAEEKLQSGAYSSFLGFTIGQDSQIPESGYFNALAIGDSCLFQIRGEDLIVRFPLDRTEAFDNRPTLVASIPAGNIGVEEAWRLTEGRWEPGDEFYLMTDALACWFLRRWELQSDPLYFLRQVESQVDFERLVNNQRLDSTEDGTRMMKNDDVTLVRCCLSMTI